jgi:hypothetical protein
MESFFSIGITQHIDDNGVVLLEFTQLPQSMVTGIYYLINREFYPSGEITGAQLEEFQELTLQILTSLDALENSVTIDKFGRIIIPDNALAAFIQSFPDELQLWFMDQIENYNAGISVPSTRLAPYSENTYDISGDFLRVRPGRESFLERNLYLYLSQRNIYHDILSENGGMNLRLLNITLDIFRIQMNPSDKRDSELFIASQILLNTYIDLENLPDLSGFPFVEALLSDANLMSDLEGYLAPDVFSEIQRLQAEIGNIELTEGPFLGEVDFEQGGVSEEQRNALIAQNPDELLGTCYPLAVINSFSERESGVDFLNQMIFTDSEGNFYVRFPQINLPNGGVILPFTAQVTQEELTNLLTDSVPLSNGPQAVRIIERAYLEYYDWFAENYWGNFQVRMQIARMPEYSSPFTIFTGLPAEHVINDDRDSLIERLLSPDAENDFIVAYYYGSDRTTIPTPRGDFEILLNHAYTVNIVYIDNVPHVRLENPWYRENFVDLTLDNYADLFDRTMFFDEENLVGLENPLENFVEQPQVTNRTVMRL